MAESYQVPNKVSEVNIVGAVQEHQPNTNKGKNATTQALLQELDQLLALEQQKKSGSNKDPVAQVKKTIDLFTQNLGQVMKSNPGYVGTFCQKLGAILEDNPDQVELMNYFNSSFSSAMAGRGNLEERSAVFDGLRELFPEGTFTKEENPVEIYRKALNSGEINAATLLKAQQYSDAQIEKMQTHFSASLVTAAAVSTSSTATSATPSNDYLDLINKLSLMIFDNETPNVDKKGVLALLNSIQKRTDKKGASAVLALLHTLDRMNLSKSEFSAKLANVAEAINQCGASDPSDAVKKQTPKEPPAPPPPASPTGSPDPNISRMQGLAFMYMNEIQEALIQQGQKMATIAQINGNALITSAVQTQKQAAEEIKKYDEKVAAAKKAAERPWYEKLFDVLFTGVVAFVFSGFDPVVAVAAMAVSAVMSFTGLGDKLASAVSKACGGGAGGKILGFLTVAVVSAVATMGVGGLASLAGDMTELASQSLASMWASFGEGVGEDVGIEMSEMGSSAAAKAGSSVSTVDDATSNAAVDAATSSAAADTAANMGQSVANPSGGSNSGSGDFYGGVADGAGAAAEEIGEELGEEAVSQSTTTLVDEGLGASTRKAMTQISEYLGKVAARRGMKTLILTNAIQGFFETTETGKDGKQDDWLTAMLGKSSPVTLAIGAAIGQLLTLGVGFAGGKIEADGESLSKLGLFFTGALGAGEQTFQAIQSFKESAIEKEMSQQLMMIAALQKEFTTKMTVSKMANSSGSQWAKETVELAKTFDETISQMTKTMNQGNQKMAEAAASSF